MSISTPFIHRPVGTTLLVVAWRLPERWRTGSCRSRRSPQVEFPTIGVNAALPGASPETMASSVATPLERQFGRIAGITEMTSSSYLGITSITLQFDLSRNIDAAARDVQAAINAAARTVARQPAEQPELPEGQPRGLPHPDSGRHFRSLQHRADVRRGVVHRPAEASRRSKAWARCSWAAARCRPCAWTSTPRC